MMPEDLVSMLNLSPPPHTHEISIRAVPGEPVEITYYTSPIVEVPDPDDGL